METKTGRTEGNLTAGAARSAAEPGDNTVKILAEDIRGEDP